MELFDAIRARRSIRAYRPDPVDPAVLRRVLDAAVLAPTACNRQPFRLYVIETAGRAEELRRLYRQPWFSQAPLVIGIAAFPGEAWSRRDGRNYAVVDATIAFDHLILAATALGLGTCWVAAFDPAVARELLGLPADAEPVAFTPLGHPAEEVPARPRRPLEELLVRR